MMNFIPNDPLAIADVPMRAHQPRPDRPSSRAGFQYYDVASEGRYNVGTPEFLFWQCSEAALAAVEMWERLAGTLNRWAENRRYLDLRQDEGADLNAYYDRTSLSFFHWTTGSKTTYSGASTDVVAHEAGHALLDAVRPDFFSSFYPEVNAFHEAFGDCIALLTALEDQPSRQRLIQVVPSLWGQNFLEATAEDLSDGVRRYAGAQHPAAAPRHAFNFFNWQLPSTLPSSGPPSVLASESHSFARVFSGCFYDLVGTLWNSQPSWSHVALRDAARLAGRLLVAAARSAPETPRFFQAMGRAMILADQQMNGGSNREAIHQAFDYHNVALGSSAMLAPVASLAGASPNLAAKAAGQVLTASTRKDLLKRLGSVPGAKMTVDTIDVGGKLVAQAVHHREVPLAKIDKRLKGVLAMAAEPVLVGDAANHAAVLGALPQIDTTIDEVQSYVQSLVQNDCVQFAEKVGAVARTTSQPTHVVRKVGKRKMLVRARYRCPAVR